MTSSPTPSVQVAGITSDDVVHLLLLIFSWPVLGGISVIASGMWLARVLSIPVRSRQLFRIPLVILHFEATDEEVLLGLTAFIFTFVAVSVLGGPTVYDLVKRDIGYDPGQLTAIEVSSALVTLIWSAALSFIASFPKPAGPTAVAKEQHQLIDEITRQRRP